MAQTFYDHVKTRNKNLIFKSIYYKNVDRGHTLDDCTFKNVKLSIISIWYVRGWGVHFVEMIITKRNLKMKEFIEGFEINLVILTNISELRPVY